MANLFAQAALSAAFVPVFTELLQAGRKKEAFRLATTLFWIVMLVLGSITVFGIVLAGPVLSLFGDIAGAELRRSSRRGDDADHVPGRAAARAVRGAHGNPAVLRRVHDPGARAGGLEHRDHRPDVVLLHHSFGRQRRLWLRHRVAARDRRAVRADRLGAAPDRLPPGVRGRLARPPHPPGVHADAAGHDRARDHQPRCADQLEHGRAGRHASEAPARGRPRSATPSCST